MLQTKFFFFFGQDNFTIQLSNYHQLVVSDNYVKQSGSQKKLVHCIKHLKLVTSFFGILTSCSYVFLDLSKLTFELEIL